MSHAKMLNRLKREVAKAEAWQLETSEARELLDSAQCGYLTFNPRPDQPARYDQQTGFTNSKTTGVKFLIGGNGAGTTTCALNCLARFVLSEQEAPRPDTPFWVIAGTYEQSMDTCWKEKLFGMGLIPSAEVDWERIAWKSEKDNHPFRVPLKPWRSDSKTNWSLEFKSYEQGRQNMQARSIGGFLFVEQFPYVLLTEVLRGCREYNFGGSKMAEFTPVDPTLSIELEEMIDEDRMPSGWEVYRANTECAVEAGHVQQSWYNEFFGMIPDEMQEVRKIGAFSVCEGAIYQGFNPLVHLVTDREVTFPPNIFYRRSIDWGSGPENAFVCEWAYFNGMGEAFFFDEYYSTDQTMTTMQHLCEVQDRHPWPLKNPHYGTTWADPSASSEIRMAQRMSEYCPDYENINISLAGNDVNAGINHVRYMLQTNPGTGRPRMFIHRRNCQYLARQMRTYKWRRGNPRGLNPKDAKPEPLKKDDHAVDAARYLLFSEAKYKNLRFETTRRDFGDHRTGVRGVKLDRGKAGRG